MSKFKVKNLLNAFKIYIKRLFSSNLTKKHLNFQYTTPPNYGKVLLDRYFLLNKSNFFIKYTCYPFSLS